MKYLITDKELKGLKTLQENLEEGLVFKKQAALTLKYAIEDIEAMELNVLDEFSGNDGTKQDIRDLDYKHQKVVHSEVLAEFSNGKELEGSIVK